jgi:hypothetical protein
MIKSGVLNISTKSRSQVSFFEDDFIDTVRHQISKGIEIHPDRLFILVGLKLPHDYYLKDPRRWEALFDRISLNGELITKDLFNEYIKNYRRPSPQVEFYAYDRIEWLSKPEALKELFSPTTDFVEYRILGTSEMKSYILPFDFSQLVSKIPSARLPIPQLTDLFSTYYENFDIEDFLILPFEDKAEPYQIQYFPLLRNQTPEHLPEETIRLLDKNSNLLVNLLKLKSPKPDSTHVIKTRFYVPWVDTDFGDSVRTRFEQIFYGLTVSQTVPYVGLFTSKEQINRHKFYVENPKAKKPFLDMGDWNTWWNLTKPQRNKPTLVFYRGTSKHNFDRITVTALDLVLSTHRPEDSTETVDQLKASMNEWLLSLDALIPLINSEDIDFGRWELQDMTYVAKYSDKIEDFDLLRFNCVSSIFDIGDKTKSQFSLLRTDHSNDGLSAIEIKILQSLKDGNVNSDELSNELSISKNYADQLIRNTRNKLEENPRLGQKSFRGYPTLKVGPDFIVVSSINEIERSSKYADILRFVLSSGENADLDSVCPKRMEKVSAEETKVTVEDLEVDPAIAEEFSDMFGDLEQENLEEEVESIAESTTTQKISTDQKQGTLYKYFKTRLQQFDPETFHATALKYPKKCEQKHQPIILSSKDLKRIEKTEYNPQKYSEPDKLVNIENPDGTIVCPDYWCMRDQIPIQESQLLVEDGLFKCPGCHGKLQTNSRNDPREFPLVKRETGFIYPGFVDYKSPKNNKPMPCCFKKSRAKKNEKPEKNEDRYYILGEDKSELGNERISYIPKTILDSLHITEKYEFGRTSRFTAGSGFFRVGLGHSSETLPKFLGLKTKIPSPRESINLVTKCSFMRSWNKLGTEHLDTITSSLKKIPEFSSDTISTNLAKIISGIDEAFHKKELLPLEELEYSAIALQTDLFRIDLNTKKLGCIFYSPIARPRSKGIVVFQDEEEINILAHATRQARGFSFQANIFDAPFKKETYVELEKLRNESCRTEIPSFNDALTILPQVMRELDIDDYSIVLDPFGRGQAFYAPSKLLLPFQSTVLPDISQSKISGYSDISNEKLPSESMILKVLEIASKFSKGYTFKEHLHNTNGQIVEILTEAGLRIPILSDSVGQNKNSEEVIETTKELNESELVFGDSNSDLIENRRDISYSSEVYEFLIFQLTKDLQEDDYIELRSLLELVRPNQKEVSEKLEDWFEKTAKFKEITKPTDFLSKIRTPCGQFKSKNKCSSNLCGWDSETGKCRIEIRDTLNKQKLFHRLLTTLVDNSKIRSMVLDGRTSPFFSTILYMELPHELIVTDNELPD